MLPHLVLGWGCAFGTLETLGLYTGLLDMDIDGMSGALACYIGPLLTHLILLDKRRNTNLKFTLDNFRQGYVCEIKHSTLAQLSVINVPLFSCHLQETRQAL